MRKQTWRKRALACEKRLASATEQASFYHTESFNARCEVRHLKIALDMKTAECEAAYEEVKQLQGLDRDDALAADARLGRMVRRMPVRSTLTRQASGGYRFFTYTEEWKLRGEYGDYSQPEDALDFDGGAL